MTLLRSAFTPMTTVSFHSPQPNALLLGGSIRIQLGISSNPIRSVRFIACTQIQMSLFPEGDKRQLPTASTLLLEGEIVTCGEGEELVRNPWPRAP